MVDELEQMMIAYGGEAEGLADRSEELSEWTEEDAEIRFYRSMAAPSVDPEVLLPRLARAVAELLFDACLVFRVVGGSQEIALAGVSHPSATVEKALKQACQEQLAEKSDGIIERIIATGEACFESDWMTERLWKPESGHLWELFESIGVHGLLIVPLVTSAKEVLGAIAVFRHMTTAKFTARDLAFAQWVAAHAAMQLETVQLYQSLQTSNEQLDRAVHARDIFISMAAHELRTPLTTMKLQVHMLMHKVEKLVAARAEAVTEAGVGMGPGLESLDVQIERLNRLISQLLDVSIMDLKEPPLELGEHDLCGVVREVSQRFGLELERAGCALTLETPDRLVGRWDRDRLDQVLTNLVSNAIKYGAGEPVEIRLGEEKGEDGEDLVRLVVRDHGMGIEPADLELVFGRYERLPTAERINGLGLGLWIVRRIVEMHRGRIWAENADGRGAQFVIVLPRYY